MSSPPRIAVLGGAFDPPHHAHVALAQAALAQLRVDTLLIIPSGYSPHRKQRLSAATHRLQMAQLAFGALPRTTVDAREIQRAGPSYTCDTLAELRAEHPTAALFLLLGADQFQALAHWREPLAVLGQATLAVAHRGGSAARPLHIAPELAAALRMQTLQGPEIDISATAVRQRCAQGLSIDEFVPLAVARYIASHHLYQSTDDTYSR